MVADVEVEAVEDKKKKTKKAEEDTEPKKKAIPDHLSM